MHHESLVPGAVIGSHAIEMTQRAPHDVAIEGF
jgi:hypothetical protein